MSGEAQNTEQQKKPAEEQAKPAQQQEAQAKPPEPKPAAKEKGDEEGKKKPAEVKAESAAVKRAVVKDDDEEIPEDADLVEMTTRGLKSRLTRYTKKQLRDRFGTDDFEKIAADLKELETFRTEKEERRKKDLSEKEKLEEKTKELEARAAKAEERAAAVEAEARFKKDDEGLRDMAADAIKPKFWKHVRVDLGEHLLDTYNSKELKELEAEPKKLGKVIKAWLVDYLKENPEYAKGADVEKPATTTLSNGADEAGKPPTQKQSPGTPAGGKTIKPGQANSMSPQEARAEAAKQGYHW